MTAKRAPKKARAKARAKAPATTRQRGPEYLLRLYVAGHTPRAMKALANLEQICQEHLAGRYSIEVVDLLKNPALARGHQILALPTVVR
jgi:circadian clock protein KaiB